MNHIQRALVGVGAVVLSTAAMAHHGWSGYETDIRKVSGTIEQASYANPHSSIRLKTADKTWVIVLAPPSRMSNRETHGGHAESGQERFRRGLCTQNGHQRDACGAHHSGRQNC